MQPASVGTFSMGFSRSVPFTHGIYLMSFLSLRVFLLCGSSFCACLPPPFCSFPHKRRHRVSELFFYVFISFIRRLPLCVPKDVYLGRFCFYSDAMRVDPPLVPVFFKLCADVTAVCPRSRPDPQCFISLFSPPNLIILVNCYSQLWRPLRTPPRPMHHCSEHSWIASSRSPSDPIY